MRPIRIAVPLVLLSLATPTAARAQAASLVPLQEFKVPDWDANDGTPSTARAARPRDPAVAPDGSIFFVGQAASYIARLDPKTGAFKRFHIDPAAHPHSCLVDARGIVWYSGNTNGTLNRLDPATGAVETFPVPEGVRDPHTMVFDKKGNIWFTAQGSNAIGHFDVSSKEFRIVKPPVPTGRRSTNPYGIALDSKGRPWINLFATNLIATIDPETFELKTYPLAHDSTLDRRIAITSDDKIWYVDYRRGFLGKFDPVTQKTEEWQLPGGRSSLPYGMTVDDRDRIWVAETGNPPKANRLVGFDPRTKSFFSITDIGGGSPNTVRYMIFDRKTKLIWFGADAGFIGKADVSGVKVAM